MPNTYLYICSFLHCPVVDVAHEMDATKLILELRRTGICRISVTRLGPRLALGVWVKVIVRFRGTLDFSPLGVLRLGKLNCCAGVVQTVRQGTGYRGQGTEQLKSIFCDLHKRTAKQSHPGRLTRLRWGYYSLVPRSWEGIWLSLGEWYDGLQ